MRFRGRLLALLALVGAAGITMYASEETHTGCVMQTEAGWFTFCEPNACSEIKGQGVDAKLAGHKITVRGTMAETATTGKTFVVTKVLKVGPACDERCSPHPSGHRGLGNHDKPGAEGGTPGAVAPAPKIPPPL